MKPFAAQGRHSYASESAGKTTPLLIPFFSSKVPAGFPSPALDYMEDRIDLTKMLVPHPLSTFLVQCVGDSMINAFIPPGSMLMVDKSLIPQNNDIVLAVVNGEFTVKFLKKNDYKCWLIPANRKFAEQEILPGTDFRVWGVVTNIITSTNLVKKCML